MRNPLSTYTAIDFAFLGVVAIVFGAIYWAAWILYEFLRAFTGPVGIRIATYGIWFMAAPVAATLIRKPLAAFLGEVLAALVEAIILITEWGFYVIPYGILQGLLSETAYLLTGYRRWDLATAALAGALAAPGAVILDALLYGEIATAAVVTIWTIGAALSGAIYGSIGYGISIAVKR